jgi:large subunit ribosomal protein L23
MSLFSDFRKKKESSEEEKKTPKPASSALKEEIKKEETKEEVVEKKTPIRRKEKTDRPAKLLESIHVSEKAARLEEEGQYVFRVTKKANKLEIARAFEEMYGVKVKKVRLINLPRKKRNWRGKTGYRSAWKKAIIQIMPGEKVNIH